MSWSPLVNKGGSLLQTYINSKNGENLCFSCSKHDFSNFIILRFNHQIKFGTELVKNSIGVNDWKNHFQNGYRGFIDIMSSKSQSLKKDLQQESETIILCIW